MHGMVWFMARGAALAAGGAGPDPESGAGGLGAWLVRAHEANRVLYALGIVAVLLVLGIVLGWLSERLLALVGLQTERVERVE